LAKCLDQESGLTLTGTFMGTPAYASPEQATGKSKLVTTASDVYSLGAVLYAVLTGQAPFTGGSTSEIIEKVKHSNPPNPRSLRPTIAKDRETICLKCLEKEPPRRYASAADLAEDLERFLESRPIAARPIRPAERLWLWARRRPAYATLASAVCLLALAVLTSLWATAQEREKARLGKVLRAQDQAAEQGRARELLQAQLLRAGPRVAGWTSN